MNRTPICFVVFVLMVSVLAQGCSSDTLAPSSGHVTLLLTDAPIDLSTVSAVNVTMREIVLFEAGSNDQEPGVELKMRHVISGEGRTVNLLDFQNGQTTVVADAAVPTGDYRRIRLRISAAELLLDDDEDPSTPDAVRPVFIPSDKVDVPVPFTVTGGEGVAVTLDFDAGLSIKVNETNGQHPYILRPVITPVGVGVR